VGLLPANMHRRVNTKAARPKMTGINAVGRSILDECVVTISGREQPMWHGINASAEEETDIKGGMEISAKKAGNKAYMFVRLTANNLITACIWHSYKEFT
jgi:hypothetical protein